MTKNKFIEINEITGFTTYLKTIDWQDPWLIGLICFHIIITTTALITRNHGNFQIVLFAILLSLVYFSETINEYAAFNWKMFSRQQYFDSKGLFISVVFSVPILLNCMLMVGSWLYESMQVMTKLKCAQLKQQLKMKAKDKSNIEKTEKVE